MKKPESVNERALKIAAAVLEADGVCCRPGKCRRYYVDSQICRRCIRAWLISKARKELGIKNTNKKENHHV